MLKKTTNKNFRFEKLDRKYFIFIVVIKKKKTRRQNKSQYFINFIYGYD